MAMRTIKGWCPGALNPMRSGDGLIIRIKPHFGKITAAQARSLALISQAFGNGKIDLTNRGHWQLRGLNEKSLIEAQSKLDRIGLIDKDVKAEAVRNVLCSPFSAIDPDARALIEPEALALEEQMRNQRVFQTLPAKFGFILEDGGKIGFAGASGDIICRALTPKLYAIGLDGLGWVGVSRHLQQSLFDLVSCFLKISQKTNSRRMRQAAEFIREQNLLEPLVSIENTELAFRNETFGHENSVVSKTDIANVLLPPIGPLSQLGAQRFGDQSLLALGVAFGRISAEDLFWLSEQVPAEAHLALTPWRDILVAPIALDLAETIALQACAQRFITDVDDTRLAIAACPGLGECEQARGDVRRQAEILAKVVRLPNQNRRIGLHISGCSKGCAHPGAAEIVMRAEEECRFSLIVNGRASDRAILKEIRAHQMISIIEQRQQGNKRG